MPFKLVLFGIEDIFIKFIISSFIVSDYSIYLTLILIKLYISRFFNQLH